MLLLAGRRSLHLQTSFRLEGISLRYERVLEGLRDAHVQQIITIEDDLAKKVAPFGTTRGQALLRKTTDPRRLEVAERSPRLKVCRCSSRIRALEERSDCLNHEEESMHYQHAQELVRLEAAGRSGGDRG